MLDPSKVDKVFAKFDTKQDGKMPTKQLMYLLKELRIVVTPEERRQMIGDIDPTKQGFFDLQTFRLIVDRKQKSIDPQHELAKIFYLYDEGHTGSIATPDFTKLLNTVLPSERTTDHQQRELMKYGREINGVVDHQQLTHYIVKMTQ